MAQQLKDEVQEAIASAALEIFARKGFRQATMADIGKAARISTGNIYRYYENKEDLFHALLTEEFVGAFVDLVRRRVKSLDGIEDIRELAPTAAFHGVSQELLAFCLANRQRVVILLGRSQGTRYETFSEELVATLVKLAIAHFRALNPELKVTKTMRFNLDRLYRNFVGMMVDILTHFHEEADIRQAIDDYSRYHLAGLKSFFG
ncbi:TetR/AcrR family transcriptional regulator [Archangium violaceum]|uniref:TetR/AcrR family transcriptional regulator n=1 Tax=Archangium violaceum TaxID=83451 RepID=UPI00194EAB86|nr:TetR/AcrR family transcriptional regulator [Archangium violaceum]QRO01790.1 TetR/AcrR family transcriptional regulator [Archangium violaceum]